MATTVHMTTDVAREAYWANWNQLLNKVDTITNIQTGDTNGTIKFTRENAANDISVTVKGISNCAFIATGSDTTKYLRNDGTWQVPYTHPTGDGNKHVPANGTTHNGHVLVASSTAGTYTWKSLADAGIAASGHTHSYIPLAGSTAITGNLGMTKTDAGYGATDSTTSCKVTLYSYHSGAHGIYSSGYYDGSTYNADGKWLVYRSTDNKVYLNGQAQRLPDRTLTIGSTGKTFNGTGNVSWTLAEIGAAASGHNHNGTYVKVAGDTMTGNLTINHSYARINFYDGTRTVMWVGKSNATAAYTGLYSQGYYTTDGTWTDDAKYIAYRAPGGAIYINGRANSLPDRTLTIGSTGKTFNGTANVSWTLAEIGAVNKAGDTMTGNLKIEGAGEKYVYAKNTTTGAYLIMTSGSSTNHGLYSYGYTPTTSSFTSDAKYMIYRNSSGTVIVNGNCTGSAGSVAWGNVTSRPSNAGSSLTPVYWSNYAAVACDFKGWAANSSGQFFGIQCTAGTGVSARSGHTMSLVCRDNGIFIWDATSSESVWSSSSAYATAGHTHSWANITSRPSNAGSGSRPVYWSSNAAVQCDTPTSGAWYKGVPQVGSDGVMEIGRYIDFHYGNTSTNDYDVRLNCTGNGALTITGTTSGTFSGSLSGNASTATALKTARTLTIGGTGKSFDGSGNVSWNWAEMQVPKMTTESYPAIIPSSGSNNWIKVGLANDSYGLLPSQSGAAGSGHNYLGTSSWYWKYLYVDSAYCGTVYASGNTNAKFTTDRCTSYAANGTVGIHSSTNRGLYEFTDSKWIIYLQNSNDTVHSSYAIYDAVWNDFAEFRCGDITEGGYAVYDDGNGYMKLCTERMQPGSRLTSDTFGISVGWADTAKTPISVAGRVLAYPAQPRENYKVGDAVCSAPDGKIDIMTREEIMMYPDRIIGIVSEIPTYEIWNMTYKAEEDKSLTETNVKVDGRIWVYVR